MKKTYPPTALETDKCPPHHWHIPVEERGQDGIGECRKCRQTKDFSGNGHKAKRKELYRELMLLKCSKGGKKNKKEELVEIG